VSIIQEAGWSSWLVETGIENLVPARITVQPVGGSMFTTLFQPPKYVRKSKKLKADFYNFL
jgi:hypothetical protein